MFGNNKKPKDVPGEPQPLKMPDYLSSDPLKAFPDPFPNMSAFDAQKYIDMMQLENERQALLQTRAINMTGVNTGRTRHAMPNPPIPKHIKKQLQVDDTWSIRKRPESDNVGSVTMLGTSDSGEEIILDPLHMALYRELRASRLALQQVEEGLNNVRQRRKETQISLLLQNEELGDDVL